MTKKTILAAGCVLALAAAPALAHHSTAMFDGDTTVVLNGTVKTFEFKNPHSWLVLDVKGPNGAVAEWRIETSGPYALSRMGLKAGVVAPGSAATATVNPMKNGTTGGNLRLLQVGDKSFRIGGGG